MHHNTLHGCYKCDQVDETMYNRTTLLLTNGNLRTNKSFRDRDNALHHSECYRRNQSPFEVLNIDMISQFPLDTMHLIDIGVTKKKMTHIIESNYLNANTDPIDFTNLSNYFTLFKKYIPSEFEETKKIIGTP